MKKVVYVGFIGGLTISAMTACYWQSNRFIQARKRWEVIRQELNKEVPENLGGLGEEDLFAFRYVVVKGKYGK